MKKFIIVLMGLVLTVGSAFAANTNFSKEFLNRLSTCTYYSESIESPFFTSKSEILGWKQDKCQFINKIYQVNNIYQIECKFSKDQINKLISAVASENAAVMQYEFKDNAIKPVATVKQPAIGIWNTYTLDKNVCRQYVNKGRFDF